MDRIERIASPQPHERTWAVTPARERERERERDAERERQERRRQRPKPAPQRPADDDEPPRLVDVQA